jgi:hypothetical protein
MKKTIVLMLVAWLFLAASYVVFRVIEEIDSGYQIETYHSEEEIENTYWRVQNLKLEV